MEKRSFLSLIVMLVCNITIQAQSKKWTLEECVTYAIQNNISIKQSELDSKMALIDKKSAVGRFLPSLNASASHSWNIGLNQDITTGLLQNKTTQFTSAAFLQVLFNKENLKVQKEQLRINEKQYVRSEELVKVGSIPRGDLLDVKATLALNNQNVITAENSLLISKLSLSHLLQLKDFENFDVVDDTDVKDENNIMAQTPSAIYEKAFEGRTELKIARTNLEIAEKNVAIAKGAFQPTLQGFYSFNSRVAYSDRVTGVIPSTSNPTSIVGFVEGTNQNVLSPNFTRVLGNPAPFFDQFNTNKGQSFGMQLSVPIFNGFSARNNVERSKVSLERSKIAVEQQNLDLQRNVYTAFADAKGALNAYESSVAALEARQGAYNYATEKYSVGLMNSFDFNQSQTLLTNAQSEVLRTKYDYIFKIKILEFYFGIPLIKN